MITPTARSNAFPLRMNSRNSCNILDNPLIVDKPGNYLRKMGRGASRKLEAPLFCVPLSPLLSLRLLCLFHLLFDLLARFVHAILSVILSLASLGLRIRRALLGLGAPLCDQFLAGLVIQGFEGGSGFELFLRDVDGEHMLLLTVSDLVEGYRHFLLADAQEAANSDHGECNVSVLVEDEIRDLSERLLVLRYNVRSDEVCSKNLRLVLLGSEDLAFAPQEG